MTLNIPASFKVNGKEAYERIMNRKEETENLEKKVNTPKTRLTPVNFISSDYIHFDVPYSFDIAISEDFGSCKGKDWNEQNRELLSNGYHMSNIIESMTLFQNVIISHKNKTQILSDSAGNPISRKTTEELYKFLTSNYKTGSFYNINALFENINGNWRMKEAIDYDPQKDELIFRESFISIPLTEDCFVDFSNLTPEGLPKTKSSKQKYLQGENLYYLSPVDGRVVGFYADSVRAGLFCGRNPSLRDSDLGVRAVRLAKI
jgi:hypothetical protein